MRRQEVIRTLADHNDIFKTRFDVNSVSIFGSVARDEANADSDVDVLVVFARSPGMFQFIRLKEYLENILSCPVDLVTKNALKKQLSERILKEAIRVT